MGFMAKFDDLLQAVKVHEVLKSKEENEKKCKFCYVIADFDDDFFDDDDEEEEKEDEAKEEESDEAEEKSEDEESDDEDED